MKLEGTKSKRSLKKSGTEESTNRERAVCSAVYHAQSNDDQTYTGEGKLDGRLVKVLRDTGCTGMIVDRAPIYPVIIGNVQGAQQMLPDPHWKVEDQPGVRARTNGGNKDKENADDQGGDIPAWMSSQEKTEKKPDQPKENDDHRT